MFTGLVEGIGKVKAVNRVGEDMRLTVAPLFDMTGDRTGDSISVNGVCLTVTEMKEGAFTVDVSGETLSRSTLGELRMGDEVNLERAVRLSDRLGDRGCCGSASMRPSRNISWKRGPSPWTASASPSTVAGTRGLR